MSLFDADIITLDFSVIRLPFGIRQHVILKRRIGRARKCFAEMRSLHRPSGTDPDRSDYERIGQMELNYAWLLAQEKEFVN